MFQYSQYFQNCIPYVQLNFLCFFPKRHTMNTYVQTALSLLLCLPPVSHEYLAAEARPAVYRFQRQQQCCRHTAAAAGTTQRPDPLLELTRSEVFAPQLGGKEGVLDEGTNPFCSSPTSPQVRNTNTHTHIHTCRRGMKNTRVSCSLTDAPPGKAAHPLKGHHCHSLSHYY